MKKKFKLTFNQLKAIDNAFRGLNNLRRWTDFSNQIKFNELSKQALNCLVTFAVAKYMVEKYGKEINWGRFPKLAIIRMFQKLGLSDVNSSTYYAIVNKKMNKDVESFYMNVGNYMIKQTICDEDDGFTVEQESETEELKDFLNEANDSLEAKIYKVSSRIATLIELEELSNEFLTRTKYASKYINVQHSIQEMSKDIPAVDDVMDGTIYGVFQDISRKLRNQNRRAVRSGKVYCSVLGHLFDTAVLAYFIGLEEGYSEELAAKMFFYGIFHDVPEAWTKDIPSPTKDAYEGFRNASVKYELDCVNKNIYNVVDDTMKTAIHSVMMEEEDSEIYKPLIKEADYLSADSECYRQLVDGTRDKYFRNHVIYGHVKKINAGKGQLKGVFKELVFHYEEEARYLKLLG